ncbi:MAG TPA: hypothetical protein VFV98_07055 [Vicinamibacterales bacterium]|nr:hypothetical protein [Vicinamibacterales bacterium]
MKAMGVVLIVLGLIGLAYGGIRWTEKDKVVDIGPVEVTRSEHKSIPFPPIAGAISLVAGVLLMVAGGRRS